MKRLRRLLALNPTERRLLVEAALLLAVIRLGLKLLPFRTFWGLFNRAARAPVGSPKANFLPDRIAWAVTVAGPRVLGVRLCLSQALAVQLLLRRRGYHARLHLGVARGDLGQVQAHAWVESNGRVVIGGSASELERYTPLPALDAKTT
jgi:Transglutaminase-like superfamily